MEQYPLDTNEKREGWRSILSCMEYLQLNQALCRMLAFQTGMGDSFSVLVSVGLPRLF